MKILIINGPNLNKLSRRDEAFYGKEDFDKILDQLKTLFPDMELDYFQSNSEGELVSKIQQVDEEGFHGLVINAAAYSHYSIALRDALEMLDAPAVEVHFSNIYGRESFRNQSVISGACEGVISGFGKDSYRLALNWFEESSRRKIGF